MRNLYRALTLASAVAFAVSPVFALKDCGELKSEIAAKVDANGGKNYQLDIVPAADVKDQTVVGSCEGGSKKITYRKGGTGDASKPAASVPPPQAK